MSETIKNYIFFCRCKTNVVNIRFNDLGPVCEGDCVVASSSSVIVQRGYRPLRKADFFMFLVFNLKKKEEVITYKFISMMFGKSDFGYLLFLHNIQFVFWMSTLERSREHIYDAERWCILYNVYHCILSLYIIQY